MPKCDAHLGPLTRSSRRAAVAAARRRSCGADCMRLRHGRQIDDSDAVKWCDVTLVGGRTAAFDPRVNQRHLAAVPSLT